MDADSSAGAAAVRPLSASASHAASRLASLLAVTPPDGAPVSMSPGAGAGAGDAAPAPATRTGLHPFWSLQRWSSCACCGVHVRDPCAPGASAQFWVHAASSPASVRAETRHAGDDASGQLGAWSDAGDGSGSQLVAPRHPEPCLLTVAPATRGDGDGDGGWLDDDAAVFATPDGDGHATTPTLTGPPCCPTGAHDHVSATTPASATAATAAAATASGSGVLEVAAASREWAWADEVRGVVCALEWCRESAMRRSACRVRRRVNYVNRCHQWCAPDDDDSADGAGGDDGPGGLDAKLAASAASGAELPLPDIPAPSSGSTDASGSGGGGGGSGGGGGAYAARRLTAADAATVNDLWTYRGPGTLDYVAATLADMPSAGVVHRPAGPAADAADGGGDGGSGGELVAWGVGHHDGCLGMVFVRPEHRRRGLARIVVRSLVAQMRARARAAPAAQRHLHRPFCYIVCGNVASQRMFAGLGWSRGAAVSWLILDPRARPRVCLARAVAEDVAPLTALINAAYRRHDRFWVDQQRATEAQVGALLTPTDDGGGGGGGGGGARTTLLVARVSAAEAERRGMPSTLAGCVLLQVQAQAPHDGAGDGDADSGGGGGDTSDGGLRVGSIGYLTVHPSLQGTGIGLRLLLAAEDAAIAQGVDALECHVVSIKPWLRSFYEDNGFRRVGREAWPAFMTHELTGLPVFFHLMRKPLSAAAERVLAGVPTPGEADREAEVRPRVRVTVVPLPPPGGGDAGGGDSGALVARAGVVDSRWHHTHAPWRGESEPADAEARQHPKVREEVRRVAASAWAPQLQTWTRPVVVPLSLAQVRGLVGVGGGGGGAEAGSEGAVGAESALSAVADALAAAVPALGVTGRGDSGGGDGGGAAFAVRLDECGPKSAVAAAGEGVKGASAASVPVMRAFTSAADAVRALVTDARCAQALRAAAGAGTGTNVVVTPWRADAADPASAFRVFVCERRVAAISQQHWTVDAGLGDPHPAVRARVRRIAAAIVRAHAEVKHQVPLRSYVMDVVVTGGGGDGGGDGVGVGDGVSVSVLDVGCFGPHLGSGSALFHWCRDFAALHGNHDDGYGGDGGGGDGGDGGEGRRACTVEVRVTGSLVTGLKHGGGDA